eukprot:TRINITY_DN30072_c0_g1_i3.p1 TRINITY_DN30072_c0_g1~~TRINITY_DN30072_c0_g1_i3.p1  ORF type:complete len:318 (-),score=66.74 TRINITY_DN30072_c0_g1_i3:41-994(-)
MELLLGCGAVSTSVRAASSEPSQEVWLETPDASDNVVLWERSVVAAMFDSEADLTRVAKIIQDAFDMPELPDLIPDSVKARDWVTHVQQFWQPLPLGDGFEVRLPWHDSVDSAHTEEGRTILQLEGGAAFGLGDHPTTQAACRFLEHVVPELRSAGASCRTLDYGSGSGVLAMCAASLGSTAVVGVDVDCPSVASAKRSLRLNVDSWPVEFDRSPMDAGEASNYVREMVQRDGSDHFDVVVANILRRPLVELELALATAAAPGAWLGLTGLRKDLGDLEAIREAYCTSTGHFEALDAEDLEGGWLFIKARRSKAAAS